MIFLVEPLADQHVHETESEGRVGAGSQDQHLVGLGGGLGAAHVDGDDARAAAPRLDEMAGGVRLARQVGAPEDDEARVGAQVLSEAIYSWQIDRHIQNLSQYRNTTASYGLWR